MRVTLRALRQGRGIAAPRGARRARETRHRASLPCALQDVAARRRALPRRGMGRAQAQVPAGFVRHGVPASRLAMTWSKTSRISACKSRNRLRPHAIGPGFVRPQVDAPWAQIRMLGQKKIVQLILEVDPIPRPQCASSSTPQTSRQTESAGARSSSRRDVWCNASFSWKKAYAIVLCRVKRFFLEGAWRFLYNTITLHEKMICPFTEKTSMELLTTSKVAKLLNMTPDNIRYLERTGRLPSIRVERGNGAIHAPVL